MEILVGFGELAWFKLVSGPDSLRGHQQVPYLAWRYDSPGEGIVEVFERAVNCNSLQFGWVFDSSMKNWLITPSRVVRELEERGNFKSQEIMCEIKDEDQEFCVAALRDFDRIIDFLGDVSSSSRRRRRHDP
ncbi:hypothetical protein [Streptomyces sp. ML-6]|uniref:hypothetical protein n=1 Tax=Streptomyces sp. ML-6 TaxID=2982693 RepID=UPI0024BF9C0F|nr:hypothetical protein [Streptomyces sp. ML-6]MDK0521263.1 hypothetical protein [Streptomyces sp. ML-6]